MEGGYSVFKTLFQYIIIATILGCGINGKEKAPAQMQEQVDDEGSYKFVLTPVNRALLDAKGLGVVHIKDNSFFVKLTMSGLSPNIRSMQHIHVGDSCPSTLQDGNSDSILDEVEGFNAYGEVLLALNSNINTHDFATNTYPVADNHGKYIYQQRGVRSSVMAGVTHSLELDRRVVVVYGMSPKIFLPDSVSSFIAGQDHSAIPIACGRIQRIKTEDFIPEASGRIPRKPVATPDYREDNPTRQTKPPSTTTGQGPKPPPPVPAPVEPAPVKPPPAIGRGRENPYPNEDRDDEQLRVLLEEVVGGIDVRPRGPEHGRSPNYSRRR